MYNSIKSKVKNVTLFDLYMLQIQLKEDFEVKKKSTEKIFVEIPDIDEYKPEEHFQINDYNKKIPYKRRQRNITNKTRYFYNLPDYKPYKKIDKKDIIF